MTRIGMLSAAHVHAPSYASALADRTDAEFVGLWDDDAVRSTAFVEQWGGKSFRSMEDLFEACDAVVVCSPNMQHAGHIEACARAGNPVLCEKPLAPTREYAERIEKVLTETGVMCMTAFPCPFSPVFQRLAQRIESGEVGKVLAVSATNRGKCPFGWFVDRSLSGGGAMVDHVVHVADLLRRLLGEEPCRVSAMTGNNMYGEDWEDTAHVTLDYPSGVFATLDSSWSRYKNYKTWGDVTLRVTGEKGVIEADLFGQGLTLWGESCCHLGTGSNLDALMVDEFLAALREDREPSVTWRDGLAASMVAVRAYESLAVGVEGR